MARSKQTKSKEGGQRKETKEERRIRLEKQAEAREKCFQLLPYAGGIILILLAGFAWYVHSVPPPPPPTTRHLDNQNCGGGGGGGGGGGDVPEFMYIDTTLSPAGQAARDEAHAAQAHAEEAADAIELE